MENRNDEDFYLKLFSLSSSPTVDELKKKYRELIKLYHPDTHPERIEWSTRMVQQIDEAYEILLAHLHRICSDSPGYYSLSKRTKVTNPEKIISMGDDALRDAVIIGWLKRTPKDDFAQGIRHTIEKAFFMLDSIHPAHPCTAKSAFYADLFSAFLKATAPRKPGPLPDVWNKTKFFQHFAAANRYLDSGIRNYYRLTENKKRLFLANIPLSFFMDGIRLFSLLKKNTGNTILKETICAKIELAELFIIRIQDPGLAVL
ncbi:MAG: J domain-containing protein [Spirochaetales bacterium]|nr:J domain-containing protein [Spirochaetales bacterium]